MPHKPSVSIILPTYNHAQYLRQSLNSVQNQTFADYEVIIVDDGSSDDTRSVVSAYLKDDRIKYHYQNNRGLAAARNTGLRLAQGDYLAFLDADDLFSSDKLAVQVNYLNDNPGIGLVSGGWDLIDDTNQLILTYLPGNNPPALDLKSQLYSCYFVPVSVMVRKEWVDKVGGFYEALRQVEDWDLWLRLAAAGCNMAWINQVVCSYRLSPGQMTKNATQQKQASLQMLDRYYAQPDISDELRSIKNEVYARLYIISAGREYANLQVENAKVSLSNAVELFKTMQRRFSDDDVDLLFHMEAYPNRHGSSFNLRKYVMSNLPPTATEIRDQRRRILGSAAVKTFYSSYKNREWSLVRQAAGHIFRYSPAHLLQRQYWSILTQSLIPSSTKKQAG